MSADKEKFTRCSGIARFLADSLMQKMNISGGNDMRKKILISCGILIVLIMLLVPFKHDILSDGGTRIYSAPLLKVVQWIHWDALDVNSTCSYVTSVYFFPENLKNINDLKKEHWEKFNQK